MSIRPLATSSSGHRGADRRPALPALALVLLSAALLLPSAAGAQQASLRIGVVDLDRIVALSPSGQALGKQLEEFQNKAQAEIDAMNAAARDLRQQIADGVNSLSEDRLAELQKQLEDKQIELRRFRDDKQREGQKMQTEGLQKIERELEPIFKSLVEEEGYDLILNRVAGVVVSASEKADVTQRVLDRMSIDAGAQ